jgi:hypothetical protein
MALTLETTLRDAIANAVDDAINVSATSPLTAGTLVFRTGDSPQAEVATITFSQPAFGAASTGVITMADAPKSDTDAAGGTMAVFSIHNGDGVRLLTGTVGDGSPIQDIAFTGGVVVTAGDTVQLTSFTITCPAS